MTTQPNNPQQIEIIELYGEFDTMDRWHGVSNSFWIDAEYVPNHAASELKGILSLTSPSQRYRM